MFCKLQYYKEYFLKNYFGIFWKINGRLKLVK